MNRLCDLREDKDLKQKDIAKILDVTQQQYSRMELEENKITHDKLIILAKFYSTSIDYILGMTDEIKPYPKSTLKK